MSLDSLENKQTIILHNCETNNKKYDLVITPHKQTIGYTRTTRQTIKQKILSQLRQITLKDFQNEETRSPNQKSVTEMNLSN